MTETKKITPPIGKFVRKLRIDHDESLEDTAKRLGMAVEMLDEIETGKRQPPLGFEGAVADAYKIARAERWEINKAADLSRSVIEFRPETDLQREFLGDLNRKFHRITTDGFRNIRRIISDPGIDPIRELLGSS